MNKWLAVGLLVVLIAAGWLSLLSWAPDEEPTATVPPSVREEFHASKPLQVSIKGIDIKDGADAAWLQRELRYLLLRGRMRVAATGAEKETPFTLQMELSQDAPARAKLTLVAPDGVIERSQDLQLPAENRLATIQHFAKQLPQFLRAPSSSTDWGSFIGTDDAAAYDSLIQSSLELFDAAGTGFTQPPAANKSRTIERLEALTRKHRNFARAWALLGIGYLSLGGEDEASLTQLAESSAQRALAADPSLADAQSALGLVSLRRGEWVSAVEHFDAALALDADAVPSLEGSACLLVDVGRTADALPIARRAVALQAGNIGANECLLYAQLAAGKATSESEVIPAGNAIEVAQVRALAAILSGDNDLARQTLRDAGQAQSAWIDPLLQAAANSRKTSDALQAITGAANDRTIKPATEVLCGVALRQSDFVFNRMLRLHKQNEPVPLRVLWLPQTDFLRKHPRFEQVVSAEGLLPFWQDHGLPDVCASEPEIYGCKVTKKR